jgi:drug/metabolite transporter (DMT)-like permease
LIAFYLVAAALSLPLFLLFPLQGSLSAGIGQLNVSVLGVALSIVLIELGFLLAYRAGGSLSSTYVLSASVVTCVMLVLGAWFFKEAVTASKLAGIGLCFAGIWLLTRPAA